MTSIPVGDFVFDHGRSCIGACSCPLPSLSPILHHRQYHRHYREDQNQTPLTDKTTTFHDDPDLFAGSYNARRSSTLYGVSIHLLRKSEIHSRNFHFAMLMSSLPPNVRTVNRRIVLCERKIFEIIYLKKKACLKKRSLYTKRTM